MSPSADDAAPPSPDTDRETARGSEGPASERAAAEPARPARHRLPRPDGFERRRVVVFALFAFGIAWSVGGVIAWTGGLRNSPQLVPGLTLGTALLASGYMFAPAVAHLLTRLLTGEGFTEVRSLLRPRPARWRVYVLAWLAPAALTLAGAGLFFAALSGVLSGIHGKPFLTGLWYFPKLGIEAKVALSTPLLFDIGVYLVVVGALTTIALELEEARD